MTHSPFRWRSGTGRRAVLRRPGLAAALLAVLAALCPTVIRAQRPAPPKSWTIDTTSDLPTAIRRGGAMSSDSKAELLGPVARDATPLNDWLRDFARRNAGTLGTVTESGKDTVEVTTIGGQPLVVAAYAVKTQKGNHFIVYGVLRNAAPNAPVIVARSTFRDALTMLRAMRSSFEALLPYVLEPLAGMRTARAVALAPRAATSFRAPDAPPTEAAPAPPPTDTALAAAIGAGITDAIAMMAEGSAAAAAPPAKASSPAEAVRASVAKSRAAPVSSVVFYQFGDLQYHPVVLFADGTSYDIDDAPVERLSPAASKAEEPSRWGLWRNVGRKYYLRSSPTSAESDYELGGGGFFPVFPGKASVRLNGRYKSVSGTTMVETSTLLSSTIQFLPSGRFTTATDFAASGSGEQTGVTVAAGSSRTTSGRYEIVRHRIVLTYDSGVTKDYFFGFGSGGDPASLDEDLIFIGRTAYVR